MTKRNRTIFFYLLIFLFLLIAPASIFYSQGYRLDFNKRQVVRTGGLFIKAIPKQADVYINGTAKKRTDFFSGSLLITNLLPKDYQVRVVKNGYFPWEKNLEIIGKQVTEGKNIILFQNYQNFNNLAINSVKNFWTTPDEKKIILYEISSSTSGWFLEVYDINNNSKNILIKESDINQKSATFVGLEFAKTPGEIIMKTNTAGEIKSFSLDYTKTSPVLTPSTSSDIVAPKGILSFKENNNEIYYLNNSGYVFKSDLTFSPKEKINKIPFSLKAGIKYALRIFSNNIFLQENQSLYLFNSESGAFEKFFESIRDIKLSPDTKKLVFFSDSEIWVLFLQDISDQPQKKTGEKIFLTRFSEKIGDIFWLNSDYLIFSSGNKIKISEIDNRDKINIYDIGVFNNPQIYLNSKESKLYILSQGQLLFSQKLLP
jgi:hypothetical protein